MKYIVFLGDGMADHPVKELGGKTPLDVANKPNMDRLAQNGILGLARTVPEGMPPGSDVANLSVFGYNPKEYYSGRSPLEAVNMGVDLAESDVTFRCNFVTLSEDERIEDCTMMDYCAGEISSEESAELIDALNKAFKNDVTEFYSGKSYRHCMVSRNAKLGSVLTPPHDITGHPVREYLPSGNNGERLLELTRLSRDILAEHPVNIKRRAEGKNPANSIWLWGEGKKPSLSNFKEKYGVDGGVISAVDLIEGIGKCAGLDIIKVNGATGNYNTNYIGKAQGAIEALKNGKDFIYIHVEAPDECGHKNEIKEKIYSIEKIDSDIIAPVMEYLDNSGHDYAIMLIPDHATPLNLMTHTDEPVPFVIYRKGDAANRNGLIYNEKSAGSTGVFIEQAHTLMDLLIKPKQSL